MPWERSEVFKLEGTIGTTMWPFTKKDLYVQPEGERILRVRIKTSRSGDIVSLRLSKGSDFSTVDRGVYYLRKEIVSSPNFDKAVLEVWLRPNYSVLNSQVEGGELIPIAEWNADV